MLRPLFTRSFNVAVATTILAIIAVPCSYAQSGGEQPAVRPATVTTGELPLGEAALCGGEELWIEAVDQSGALPDEIADDLAARDGLQQPTGSRAGSDSTKTTGQAGGTSDRFGWDAALRQSLLFLLIEHGFRVAIQPGTRAELKGPFFKDWFASARNLRHWRDGDPFYVNYLGHPLQGAATGFIQVQNDPRGIKLTPGLNRAYVRSRMRAMGWSLL